MSSAVAPTAVGPVLNAIEPQLFVADVKISCDFYASKLGFKVAFLYGDPRTTGRSAETRYGSI